jgi:hypothetical protein
MQADLRSRIDIYIVLNVLEDDDMFDSDFVG